MLKKKIIKKNKNTFICGRINILKQDPAGPSQAQKPSCVPSFLFVGKGLQPPRLSTNSKGQIQTVTDRGSDGMQKQRKSTQETIVQRES